MRAARIARPLAIAPDSAIGPSNHCRVSATKANGDITPAWPPAPADTRIRPSAPFSITRSGTEMMNSGAPITGMDRRPLNKAGMDMGRQILFVDRQGDCDARG